MANANDLVIQAINAGKISTGDATSLLKNYGATEFGDGKATAYFNANQDANNNAMAELTKRGLVPQNIAEFTSNQIQNPTLANGAEFVPQLQSVGTGETLDPNAYNINGTKAAAPNTVSAPTINQTNAYASTVDQTQALAASGTPQTYDASLLGNNAPQGTATQGTVQKLATVQGQLEKLYSDLDGGETPAWAKTAVAIAEDTLAARGLGASTIGGSALFQAVQDSALPIAAADANTYFQMDLKNFDAAQQTMLANLQVKQQALLSDQSAQNAAKQFNATSVQQLQQFQSSLIAQIQQQNADRVTSISQFNAAQANQVAAQNAGNQITTSQFNEQMRNSVEVFNAQVDNQREQFNSQMRYAIDQGNAVWRRQVNTANTAAVNAAIQTNVQNLYNMSTVAQNNLWQAWRDEASWIWQSSENQLQRNAALTEAANNRQYLTGVAEDKEDDQLADLLGQFAFNWFK